MKVIQKLRNGHYSEPACNGYGVFYPFACDRRGPFRLLNPRFTNGMDHVDRAQKNMRSLLKGLECTNL